MFWYHLLDYFFLIFHTAFTLFNIVGWIWKKTRVANLVTLSATALSWFGLGIFYGIGFCPLTQWHWQVLEKLGNHNLPYSYIQYLVYRLTSLHVDPIRVQIITAAVFFVACFMSCYLLFFRRIFNTKAD
ncbi:MAG: DUF2784 domain-containing protein [Bacteroidota bacterium]